MTFERFQNISLALTLSALVVGAVAAFAQDAPIVIDPVTGESVSLAEIDIESLTDEQRRDIGDQLAEQGIAPGPRGAHGPHGGPDSAEGSDAHGGPRGPVTD